MYCIEVEPIRPNGRHTGPRTRRRVVVCNPFSHLQTRQVMSRVLEVYECTPATAKWLVDEIANDRLPQHRR